MGGTSISSAIFGRIFSSRKHLIATQCGILLGLAACATGSPSDEQEAQVRYQVGLSYFSDGQYPQSLEHLQAAHRLAPRREDVQLQMGLVYDRMGRPDLAVQTIRPLCQKRSDWAECWNNLAVAELDRRQPALAAEAAQRAIAILTYATPELAWANLSRARAAQGDVQGALQAVGEARKRQPENCQLKALSAEILVGAARYEDALREAKLGTNLCPQEGLPHLWEAYSYYKMGDRPRAERKYRSIVEQFRRGAVAEQAVVALDQLKRRTPIPSPRL